MRTISSIILACAVAGSAGAQRHRSSHYDSDRDRGRVIDTATWQWHGPLASGKELRVTGIFGDIIAKPARGSEVVVHAVKRARRHSDTADVQIHVEKSSDGITVCAVYPNQDARADECPDGSSRRRRNHDNDCDNECGNVEVQFTVEVPAGVDFAGSTVMGDVEADSMPANAEVRTVDGDASLSARGHGSASTVNGSVNVTLGKTDWGRDGAEFQTVNGDVVVSLPADLNAEITASTLNGDLITDFPLTVQGRFNRGRMRGKIGTGGADLSFSTVNGDIKIKKR